MSTRRVSIVSHCLSNLSSSSSSSSSSSVASSHGSGFRMITDGLPPEIAAAAQELALQVAALGLDLNAESIELASHHGDNLYREFVNAGATLNEFGELHISLGQFYRHLRARPLTQTEQLQAIVDVDLYAETSASKLTNRKMMLASPGRKSRGTTTTTTEDDDSSSAPSVFDSLENCRLNFNQVSALIRHHTSGPSRRLRAVTLGNSPSGSPTASAHFSDTRSVMSQRSSAGHQHRREDSTISAGGVSSANSGAVAASPATGGEADAQDQMQKQNSSSSHQQQHQEQQHQEQNQHGGHYARGKGGFVTHQASQQAAAASPGGMFAWQERLALQQQQQQQQGDGISGSGSGGDQYASGEYLPPDEAEADFEGEFGEHGPIGFLSKRDEMMSKIDRASLSPQRVHGVFSGNSDSVVPPHMRPNAHVPEGFGATTSAADAAMMAERAKRNGSPEKRLRMKQSGLTGRTISPDERFRAFQDYQHRQEARGKFCSGASRPTSACTMRSDYNQQRYFGGSGQQQQQQQQNTSYSSRPGSPFSHTSASTFRTPAPPTASSSTNNTRPQTQNSNYSGTTTSSQQQKKKPRRPASFGYYSWFKSTNRTLPQSAFDRGFDPNVSGRKQQQQNQQFRPESRMEEEEIPAARFDDDEETLDNSFRPGSSMNMNNNSRPTSARPGTATSQGSFYRRPGTAQSNLEEDEDEYDDEDRRRRSAVPFMAAPTRSVIGSVPAALIPERVEVAFAKLHEKGAAYMVRPASATAAKTSNSNNNNTTSSNQQYQHQPRRPGSVLEDIDEDVDDWDDDEVDTAFTSRKSAAAGGGGGNTKSRKPEAVSWEGSSSRPTSATTAAAGASAFDRTLGSGDLSRFTNSNNRPAPLTGAIFLHKDEQPRVRDDDTSIDGLFKMMRAHWGTRTIQRWFRAMRLEKHTAAALVMQAVGRGLMERRVLGAIPIMGDDGQLIPRIKLYTQRLQRVGRGFIAGRKQLATQYALETFDRDIGRFASHMGLKACLTTASASTMHHHALKRQSVAASVTSSPFLSPAPISRQASASSLFGPIVSLSSPDASPTTSALLLPPTGSPGMWSSQTQEGVVTPLKRRPEQVRLAYAAAASASEEEEEDDDHQHEQTQDEKHVAGADGDVSPRRHGQHHHFSPFFSRSRLKRNEKQLAEQADAEAAALAGEQEAARRHHLKWHKPEKLTSATPSAEDRRLLRFLNKKGKQQQSGRF